MVNKSQAELIQQYPELDEVEFARSQEELPILLGKVGEGVEALFSDFVSTASTDKLFTVETQEGKKEIVRQPGQTPK